MQMAAAEVLKRRVVRSGLLGVPICAADHWTLLCFRRSSTGTEIRYYDSLRVAQVDCLQIANQVISILMPGQEIKDRSNCSVQSNSVDCGVFLLHYWEAEIRRHEGYGWQAGWPQTNKEIKQRKARLINILEQIDAFMKKPAVETKKKKKIPAVTVELPDPVADDKARLIKKADLKLKELAELALKAADEGSVPFYGCSRCRYIRTGCIDYKCNPEKFLKHYEKFPEKYRKTDKGQKILLEELWPKLTIPELIGGGVLL